MLGIITSLFGRLLPGPKVIFAYELSRLVFGSMPARLSYIMLELLLKIASFAPIFHNGLESVLKLAECAGLVTAGKVVIISHFLPSASVPGFLVLYLCY